MNQNLKYLVECLSFFFLPNNLFIWYMVNVRKTISLFETNQAHRTSAEVSQNGHVITFYICFQCVFLLSLLLFDTVYLKNMYGLVYCCHSCALNYDDFLIFVFGND